LGAPSILDTTPLPGASYSGTLSSHIIALIRMQAEFLTAHLVTPDGQVKNSYDLLRGAADSSPTTLEAETAAIRGLLEAYLATSDSRYRQLADTIYTDLQQRFWQSELRLFRTVAGEDSLFTYTPIRFGLLQGALRQYYKLVASQPG